MGGADVKTDNIYYFPRSFYCLTHSSFSLLSCTVQGNSATVKRGQFVSSNDVTGVNPNEKKETVKGGSVVGTKLQSGKKSKIEGPFVVNDEQLPNDAMKLLNNQCLLFQEKEYLNKNKKESCRRMNPTALNWILDSSNC